MALIDLHNNLDLLQLFDLLPKDEQYEQTIFDENDYDLEDEELKHFKENKNIVLDTESKDVTVDTVLEALKETLNMFKTNPDNGVKAEKTETETNFSQTDTMVDKQEICLPPGKTHTHVYTKSCKPSEERVHVKQQLQDLTWKHTKLVSCPAQSYHMRMTLMGEFFET